MTSIHSFVHTIQTILIAKSIDGLSQLQQRIFQQFPKLSFCGKYVLAEMEIGKGTGAMPDLAFVKLSSPCEGMLQLIEHLLDRGCEVILLSDNESLAVRALNDGVAGSLILPLSQKELEKAVNNAIKRINPKKELTKLKGEMKQIMLKNADNELIGIPTLQGLEFVPVEDIIRCEGMQRCTKIITQNRKNMVSAYNLGAFAKLLEPYHFFSPHRSHLINLKLIKSYFRSGIIKMIDNSEVPMSKRKKNDFLALVKHL